MRSAHYTTVPICVDNQNTENQKVKNPLVVLLLEYPDLLLESIIFNRSVKTLLLLFCDSYKVGYTTSFFLHFRWMWAKVSFRH